MTTSAVTPDQSWAALAGVTDAARGATMRQRFTELAALPDAERLDRVTAMALAEFAMPDESLRPFVASRIKLWLDMDQDTVRSVAAAYDASMSRIPGPLAMRRVAVVQTLARDFSLEDQERLRALVPAVFADQGSSLAATMRAERPVETPAPAAKKPWWAFWKK